MSDLRFFMLEPDVVFQAQIDQASFDYPIQEVTYDNVTVGSHSDIRTGMMVLFGDTQGGDNLGRQRVRKLPTADTLYIGRSSQGTRDGEVKLADGRWITVLRLHTMWAKTPYIDESGTVQKDADVDFQDESPPVSNVGAGMAGTIDSGTSKLQVTLPHESNTSFATHDGASISTYAWELPSGVTLDSGTINDSQITVNCDPGAYMIACTVTDSNGKSHGAWVPVLAIDPTDDPTIKFQVESHTRTPAGQELSVRILEDIPASTYPDGTLVMMWDGEPSGPTDRSHMEFVGWHHTEEEESTAERTGTLKGTVLNCLDAAGKLRTLPGFPQTVAANDSPENWLQMADPNMDKYGHYLLYWHSTALELADFSWSGTGSTFEFVVLSSDGESLWDQVNRRAQAMTPDRLLTCNRLGQMAVTVDPMVQDAADRSATVQTTLTEGDWRDIRYTGQRPPRIHWHRRGAILASGSQINAVFCVAPGEAPGQGLDANEQDEKLTPSQAVLNSCEGHRYARQNAPHGYLTITLVDSDTRDIEPADLTWVQLTVSSDTAARRGLTFSTARGLVREMNIGYEHQPTGTVKTIELLWERETSGTAAVTVEVESDALPEPEYEPGDDEYEPDPTPTGSGDGFGTVYVMTAAKLGRTRDLSATSPAWSDITPAGVSTCYDFILDPWSPTTTGLLLTEDGVHKSNNLDDVSPTWTLVLDSSTDLSNFGRFNKIVGSINVEDYFAIHWTDGGAADRCARTTDGGSSWDVSTVIPTSIHAGSTNVGAFDIVPHLVGGNTVLYSVYQRITDTDIICLKSTDGGATWSTTTSTGLGSPGSIAMRSLHCPYSNNADGNTLYIAHGSDLYYSGDGGASFTQIDSGLGTVPKRWGAETHTQDSDRVYYWDNSVLQVSVAGPGGAFSSRSMSGLSGTVVASGGFPFVESQYYALTDEGIFVTTNGGDSWADKTGDWSLGFTSSTSRAVVVPLWVDES